jgi:hypothetical protein
MIQRLQTLWLLLGSACAFLSIEFPFFYINSIVPGVATEEYNATSNVLLLVLTSILGALLLFLIFMYKNRKLQMRLCFLALFISVLNIYLYFHFGYQNQSIKPGIALSSAFTFLIPIFCIMALRGINRDIKLIRSLDRIR